MKNPGPYLVVLLITMAVLLVSGGIFPVPSIAGKPFVDDQSIYLPGVFNSYGTDPASIYSKFWPTARHDMARTGYNAGEEELHPPLELVWSSQFDTDYSVSIITASEDDLAVTASGPGATGSNAVFMLEATDGSKRWDFTLPNGGRGAMKVAATFDANSVYFGGQKDSHFYSLFRDTGALKWEIPGFENLLDSQQAVIGGTVFGPDDVHGIFAVSSDSGDLIWGQHDGNGERLPVAWRDGIVYGVRKNNELVAFDAASGSVIWTYSPVYFPGLEHSWIIGGEENIVVRSGFSELKSLNPTDGSLQYTKTYASDLSLRDPVLADGRLFVPIYSQTLSGFLD
jgi:outer membrane protein assembly factor BamB